MEIKEKQINRKPLGRKPTSNGNRWSTENTTNKARKDIKGIHSSKKAIQNRVYKDALDKMLFKQLQIDFEKIFKTFNTLL